MLKRKIVILHIDFLEFDRRSLGGKLFDKYPFPDQIKPEYRDEEIIEDRIHPREVRENAEEMRKKMEKIN